MSGQSSTCAGVMHHSLTSDGGMSGQSTNYAGEMAVVGGGVGVSDKVAADVDGDLLNRVGHIEEEHVGDGGHQQQSYRAHQGQDTEKDFPAKL